MNATKTATSGTPQARSANLEVVPAGAPEAGESRNFPIAPDALQLPSQRTALETAPPIGSTDRPNAQVELSHRKKCRTALGTLASSVLMGVVLYGGYCCWAYTQAWVKTDNAYVTAHVHNVSARVAGTVNEVLIDENQLVKAGAVLARLDRADFEVRCQQALGQVAQAEAQLKQAKAQIAQAQAQVAREQARALKAKSDSERATSLYHGASGAISKQEFEQAQSESDAAQAALQGAGASLELAQASELAARAQVQVARANLQDTELQLSYAQIVAPASGRIGKKNLEVGNRVQPGQGLLALVQPDVWVTANFKETQLARLKAGQKVQVTLDAVPGRSFAGRVDSLSPASGAQFALLPPDNATGNFTKIVQRIPVKIVLEHESLRGCENQLAAGMSAIVKVNVRE